MTGKPTPGEWRYVAGTCGVYRTSDDVTIVDYGGLQFPDNDGPVIAAAGTSAHQLYEAGYDGLEAVKALPELMKALKRFIAAVGRDAFDPPGDDSPTLAEVIVEADTLLSRLTKKGDTDDSAE